MITKENCKTLIAQNKIAIAIEKLKELFNSYSSIKEDFKISEFENELILLSSRFNMNRSAKRSGKFDYNKMEMQRLSISSDLLNFVVEIEDEVFEPEEYIKNRNEIKLKKTNKENFEFDIFLGFSIEDKNYTKWVAEEFQRKGWKVFLPDIKINKNFEYAYFKKIEYALSNSRFFVLVCTPNSMKSELVRVQYEAFYQEQYSHNLKLRQIFLLKGEGFNIGLGSLFYKQLKIDESVDQLINRINDFKINGKSESVVASLIHESYMAELDQIKSFSEIIQGLWWERIYPDNESAISYVTIDWDKETKRIYLSGEVYNSNSEKVSGWHSVHCSVNYPDKSLLYNWEELLHENESKFREGLGEIEFDVVGNSVVSGQGIFSEVIENKDHFIRKRTLLRRCTDLEMDVMTSKIHSKIKLLIQEKLKMISF